MRPWKISPPLLARAECSEKLAQAVKFAVDCIQGKERYYTGKLEPMLTEALAAWDSIKKEGNDK